MTEEKHILAKAISDAKEGLASYRVRSEIYTFETFRALDHLYCRELFSERYGTKDPREAIMTWGINQAIGCVMPEGLSSGPFRLFPSTRQLQEIADDLLFKCGSIQIAQRLETWLHRGLTKAKLRTAPRSASTLFSKILEIDDTTATLYSEEIGRAGSRWMSSQQSAADAHLEHALAQRHLELLPELRKRVRKLGSWGMDYAPSPAVNQYFLDWAVVYLRRMVGQDLIGVDDVIGGRTYNEYLGVIAALSGRSQRQLCFSSIMADRHPRLMLQNLLTSFSPKDDLIVEIAAVLDADTVTVGDILEHLLLTPENVAAHTESHSICWAPAVQASLETCILPIYGLDISPFSFLLAELRRRYGSDWFRVANIRERRWIQELDGLFSEHWLTNNRNVRLQRGRKDVTDIDYAAFRPDTGELVLLQLKWQHQVGADVKLSRNAGSNLISEGNKWVEAVDGWVAENGVSALMTKLGFSGKVTSAPNLLIITRYGAYFSGYDTHDKRAIWTDWGNFLRGFAETGGNSANSLVIRIGEIVEQSSQATPRGSFLSLPDLAVVVNAIERPEELAT